MDLNGPFLLGGLPSLPDDFPVENSDFIGCIRDLHIDHAFVDLATNVEDKDTLPGCEHKDDFCDSDPCYNGASCTNEWNTYKCGCPAGTGGKNCEEGEYQWRMSTSKREMSKFVSWAAMQEAQFSRKKKKFLLFFPQDIPKCRDV